MVSVTDPSEDTASRIQTVTFEAPPANQNPVFIQAQVLSQDEFQVVIAASATDADGDSLSYEFEWGDGSANTISATGVAEHQFPVDQFEAYQVVVNAADGRGGFASTALIISIDEPENSAPEFAHIQFVERDGFNVVIDALAVDADGDPLTYTIDWGDGSQPTIQQSGVAAHEYAKAFIGRIPLLSRLKMDLAET